jgi:trehalose synthase-fused probable maltokinase
MDSDYSVLVFVAVEYTEGPRDTYVLPLVRCAGETKAEKRGDPGRVLCVSGLADGREIILCDAFDSHDFLQQLLDAMAHGRLFPGRAGDIQANRTSKFETLYGPRGAELAAVPLRAEQSNTSVKFGDRLILKFFRRLQEGVNPDLEIGLFLTEKARFPHVPAVAGSLDYLSRDGKQMSLGILQAFVRNEGNAWDYALRAVAAFYESVQRFGDRTKSAATGFRNGLLAFADEAPPPEVAELAGPFLGAARILGERTAQLHTALASDASDPSFAPEPFTPDFVQALSESIHEWISGTLRLLQEKTPMIPDRWRVAAVRVAAAEEELHRRARETLARTLTAMRTRIHGDYHLGQVLFTGSDFVMIDFEGEPARPIQERRIKRSPLQDVAGMLRSFHYAAYVPLLAPGSAHFSGGVRSPQERELWAEAWWQWTAGSFLAAYLAASARSCFLPNSREELKALLDFHFLEKAIYELNYELNNRPEWVGIPLRGLSALLENAS